MTSPDAERDLDTGPGPGPDAERDPDTRPGPGPDAERDPDTRPGPGPDAERRSAATRSGPAPSIAILGPGGVGGFLAVALERAGTPVTIVAREATAALLARDGLRLESRLLGDATARPTAVARLEQPADVLIVATKALGLEDALARVAAEPGLVVPLLNGLDHVALLRARWGPRVAAATIRIESDRPAPGRIVQTSVRAAIELASDDPAPREALERLAQTLAAAGVPTRVGAPEAAVLWSKLTRLNAIACMTSAHDLALGEIRDDPVLRAELEDCVRETAAVATAAGAPTDPAATLAELDGLHAAQGSSMRRDLAAGRAPELDAIAGAVLRAGDRHGIPCPTIERLAARIAARAGVASPRR